MRATAPTLLDSLDARDKQGADETDRQWLDRKYQPLIDAVLQRAVHLHRALVALRQI